MKIQVTNKTLYSGRYKPSMLYHLPGYDFLFPFYYETSVWTLSVSVLLTELQGKSSWHYDVFEKYVKKKEDSFIVQILKHWRVISLGLIILRNNNKTAI